MFLYIGVAVWPLIVGWLYNKRTIENNNQKLRNIYMFFAIVPIFVILAFRGYYMGADTGLYAEHFVHMIDTPLDVEYDRSRMEMGYLILVKGITYITTNPLYFQLICMALSWIGLYEFIKSLDDDDAFLFLYFYCTLGLFFFMFTGVRQCLAMSLCLLAYRFQERRRYVLLIICLFLAFYIHKSSCLFIGAILIQKMKVNYLNTALYLIAALIAGRYLESIQDWFNDQLEYTYEIEETGNGIIFFLVLISLTVFSFIVTKHNNKDQLYERRLHSYININFVTLFFWLMRLQTRTAERPSYYFMFFSCAFFATALNNSNPKMKTVYKIVICTLLMALYIYRLKTNFSSFVPYEIYREGYIGQATWN